MHGVDYYAGLELAEPAEWGVHLVQLRTLRGPRPEEGEEADAAQGTLGISTVCVHPFVQLNIPEKGQETYIAMPAKHTSST